MSARFWCCAVSASARYRDAPGRGSEPDRRGDGRQLNQLIAEGLHGDAVLIPEYLHEILPVIGRGGLTWKVSIRRPGPPIHEVMRPREPNVIAIGTELVERLLMLDLELAHKS